MQCKTRGSNTQSSLSFLSQTSILITTSNPEHLHHHCPTLRTQTHTLLTMSLSIKKASQTRSSKAGLKLPVGRTQQHLRKGNFCERLGVGEPVYLTSPPIWSTCGPKCSNLPVTRYATKRRSVSFLGTCNDGQQHELYLQSRTARGEAFKEWSNINGNLQAVGFKHAHIPPMKERGINDEKKASRHFIRSSERASYDKMKAC